MNLQITNSTSWTAEGHIPHRNGLREKTVRWGFGTGLLTAQLTMRIASQGVGRMVADAMMQALGEAGCLELQDNNPAATHLH
jgi:hypothetical protein